MSSTRKKLIDLLSESDKEYISGQRLSEQLKVSRTAIWKHMKDLEKDGYEIESKPRKGYRIIKYPKNLTSNTLKWGLNTKWLGKKIVHRKSIDSTQFLAHELAQKNESHGTIVIADIQTNALGRMDRTYYSTSENGLWFSFILCPKIPPFLAPQLTLLTATVLAEVIEENYKIRPTIKWPNDLLLGNKKIAGILTEMKAEQDQIKYVVIGIGINVNIESNEIPSDLKNKATSLKIYLNQSIEKIEFAQSIFEKFEEKYDEYVCKGFKNVKQIWQEYSFPIGTSIKINSMQNKWNSKFLGIADDGALKALDKEGNEKKYYSAEINWFKEE